MGREEVVLELCSLLEEDSVVAEAESLPQASVCVCVLVCACAAALQRCSASFSCIAEWTAPRAWDTPAPPLRLQTPPPLRPHWSCRPEWLIAVETSASRLLWLPSSTSSTMLRMTPSVAWNKQRWVCAVQTCRLTGHPPEELHHASQC